MSEPTFTDEQIVSIAKAIWPETWGSHVNGTIAVLDAALAQGVVLKVESGPLSPMPCPHSECKCPYWHPTICMKCGHSVALPKANVEDARVQATIENLKCWAEEWDQTGMSHEAALCRQMAETVERLAAERQDVASPRSAPGAQGGRLTEVGGDHKRATAVSDGHEPSALQGSVPGALIADDPRVQQIVERQATQERQLKALVDVGEIVEWFRLRQRWSYAQAIVSLGRAFDTASSDIAFLLEDRKRLKKCLGEVAAIAQEMNDARWGYSSDFVEVLDRLIAIGEAMQDEG